MEGKPLVSVITVTYNSARYVKAAIDSVLCQTYTNIEYIIADDCSTDDTWSIIQAYSDPRIRAYRNETNLREYPNRKKAVSLAKGDYVIFIDGDDVIFPHGIETYMYYASLFPEAGMLIQKGYINNIVWPVVLTSSEVIRNAYVDKVNLLASSFVSNFFKRTALESAGGISTDYKTGDEIVRLKIAARFPVAFIPGWLSWPRETPGQASTSIPEAIQLNELFKQGNELTQFLAGSPELTGLQPVVKGSIRIQITRKIRQRLKRLGFAQAFRYKSQYGISFSDLLSSNDVSTLDKGVLSQYTSVSPLQYQRENA